MYRPLLMCIVAAILAEASLGAHHGYAAYDRQHTVSIEGEVEQVAYENPHTILIVRTSEAAYTVEWDALSRLHGWGVVTGTVKAGDHVLITGYAPSDRFVHKLSLVTEIQRPADGWHWSRPRPAASKSTGAIR